MSLRVTLQLQVKQALGSATHDPIELPCPSFCLVQGFVELLSSALLTRKRNIEVKRYGLIALYKAWNFVDLLDNSNKLNPKFCKRPVNKGEKPPMDIFETA